MSNTEKIATLTRLRKMRDAGIVSTTVDGVTTTFRTFSELKVAILDLERELGYRPKKVRTRSVFMGHR